MTQTLMLTHLSGFNILSVKGGEPLYNYKKTLGIIKSRMGEKYTDFLAEPRLKPDGKVVEWTTSVFDSKPRTLASLHGAERDEYESLLSQVMAAYADSLPGPSDDAYPLMTKLVIVPDEDCIFCADSRIVITEWGLKPRATNSTGIDLLTFARRKPAPAPQPVAPTAATPEPADEVKTEPTPAITDEDVERIRRERQEAEARRAAEAQEAMRLAEQKRQQSEQKPEQPKKKRTWLRWLLIALALIALGVIVWLCLRSCSKANAETVDNIEKVAPVPTQNDLVMDSDSTAYVVRGCLNIMVQDGGDLNEFMQAFRQEWPDTDKYQFTNPDTVLNRVKLLCPEKERDALKKDIPQRLSDFRLIVASEVAYGSQARTNDPAMSDPDKSYYFDMVNAYDAWDIEQGSDQVIVAVLDGDIDISHPEIKDKIVKPWDVVTKTNKVPLVPQCGGHGTHTSSTAVGLADNSQGAAGIAPGCKLMPVNIFAPAGYSTLDYMIDGVMYAVQNGADIISMSVGGMMNPGIRSLPLDEQKELAKTTFLAEAEMWDEVCKYCEENGVLLVKSAGNDNCYTGVDPNNRSSHELLVSCVGADGEQSIWDPIFFTGGSNFGDLCDISAPGTQIYNAVPHNKYEMMDGTSMATPMVAGGAALLKSHNSSLTPAQMANILVASANPQPKADIGPIMDLAAALQTDPNNLANNPGKGKERQFTPPGSSIPGRDLISKLFGPIARSPYTPGTPSPRSPFGGTNPSDPFGGSTPSMPLPDPSGDCDMVARQYEALLQLQLMIEDYLQQLRSTCPECMQALNP